MMEYFWLLRDPFVRGCFFPLLVLSTFFDLLSSFSYGFSLRPFPPGCQSIVSHLLPSLPALHVFLSHLSLWAPIVFFFVINLTVFCTSVLTITLAVFTVIYTNRIIFGALFIETFFFPKVVLIKSCSFLHHQSTPQICQSITIRADTLSYPHTSHLRILFVHLPF